MARLNITRRCRICGATFNPRKDSQTLCSHQCRAQSKTTRVTLLCRECGGEFTREPNQVRSGRKYFCSRECGFKHGKPFEKKFWNKIEKTDSCWLWHGTRGISGHGQVRHNGRPDLAHRVSYMIHKGPIPEGMVVRHKCDNPPCVNPYHLELGSAADNMRDKMIRNRQAKGESQGFAKFTNETVKEARRLRAEGWTYLQLEKHFGVSRQTISHACRGNTWKHVKP